MPDFPHFSLTFLFLFRAFSLFRFTFLRPFLKLSAKRQIIRKLSAKFAAILRINR